ncbi:hypothetical protein N7462_003212 [Penicillium macrosclerotiorum]|uniref:uncharacterized protein n=1 Tax=Penicillium macrosclerotiorum TaxID=303699 RepID=UPI0025472963|nr:uncharacterized protein N7462_003212 [Penicillium macrosclerotiorum]KAJ5688820.1 hypothetical protein N7462_003212 [Penicillium macrosclerotiorum]
MARAVSNMWERYCLRAASESTATLLPVFLYGTAWKRDRTADLVYTAINTGFRAIDTAAQPRHYQEALVGDGIRRAIADGLVQTKFSPLSAQDPENMPYDPQASVTDQVHASVRSSLHNLRPHAGAQSADVAYLDTVVLHSPLPTLNQTLEAWRALETYVPHRIRNLGLSNCSLPLLEALFTSALTVKPAVVQNRFYEDTLFDKDLRIFCGEHQIIYQSFWTLTANPELVQSGPVQKLANLLQITPAASLYTLVMGLGNIVVLNGTKNQSRMLEDLAAPLKVEEFSRRYRVQWEELLAGFRAVIGDPNP